MIKPY